MKALEFLQDVKKEFAKVAWPSSKDVLSLAAVVVFVAVVFALIFTAFDAIIFKAVKLILNIG